MTCKYSKVCSKMWCKWELAVIVIYSLNSDLHQEAWVTVVTQVACECQMMWSQIMIYSLYCKQILSNLSRIDGGMYAVYVRQLLTCIFSILAFRWPKPQCSLHSHLVQNGRQHTLLRFLSGPRHLSQSQILERALSTIWHWNTPLKRPWDKPAMRLSGSARAVAIKSVWHTPRAIWALIFEPSFI